MIVELENGQKECTCELCGHEWKTRPPHNVPTICGACRRRPWDGPKKYKGRPPGQTSVLELPKPTRLRA